MRSLDDDLRPEEAERLHRLLAASPALRAEAAQLQRLRAMVRSTARHTLRLFFADRVMRRLVPGTAAEESFADALLWLFRRVALAGLLLAMILAAYNITTQPFPADQSALEAALALPPVTLNLAYDLDQPAHP